MPAVVKTNLTFVGREKELFQLNTLYEQRQHVLISGPTGIGKSALLNQVRLHYPFLVCDDPSKLSRICDSLERQFDWPHSLLGIIERKTRLLTHIDRRAEAVAFDHVGHTSPCIARFMAQVSDHVPVWIVCRSELPHDIGRVWEYLSNFVRMQISPLKSLEIRLLIAQAVSKGVIRADALKHTSSLYKICKGNPRLLEESLIELSKSQNKTSFDRCLLDLKRRIQEFEINLATRGHNGA